VDVPRPAGVEPGDDRLQLEPPVLVGELVAAQRVADEDGRFELETIVPGLYPGRTRHIHVRAQAPDRPVLTTQLYFPDEPANERDGLFDPALLVAFEEDEGGDGRQARFDFVLDVD
jgi:protocatechuate 3,4-dioxygenase beta subunit